MQALTIPIAGTLMEYNSNAALRYSLHTLFLQQIPVAQLSLKFLMPLVV
jgi:hypothetical protein